MISKALCRDPLQAVTWFVDGREVAATGPPYELPLDLSRGRHRLTVVRTGRPGKSPPPARPYELPLDLSRGTRHRLTVVGGRASQGDAVEVVVQPLSASTLGRVGFSLSGG